MQQGPAGFGTPTPPPSQPVGTPPPPAPYTATPPVPPKIRHTSDGRDGGLAILLLLLSVLTANFCIYGGFHLGYALCFPTLLLTGGLYLGQRLNAPSLYGWLCLAAAAGGIGLFVWHNDNVIQFFGFFGMLFLTAVTLLDTTGTARRDGGTAAVIWDVLRLTVAYPLQRLEQAIPAIFLVRRGDKVEKRRMGGAFLGLLCALPVLLVVVPLLISADAAFEGLLRHTVLDNLGEMFGSVVLGVLLFCLLFSLLYGLRHRLGETPLPPARERSGVSAMALNTFLGTVGAVYVIYLFSQLAYFLSAFSGILPDGFTVAQYARRGFFEMAVICTINLMLVAISLSLSRKQEGKAPLSTRLVALFILLFSVGLVATALSKMVLYIDSFGMTRLRILTSVFMGMLAAVLLYAVVRLFAVRFPYMKATVITVALFGLLVGYADVDTTIARYNVAAYESGRLEELDLTTLSHLSDGATPYLVELWDQRTEEQEWELASILYNRLTDFGDEDYVDGKSVFRPDATDFRHFNVDRARARRLLLERADEICEVRHRPETEYEYRYDDEYGYDGEYKYEYDGYEYDDQVW